MSWFNLLMSLIQKYSWIIGIIGIGLLFVAVSWFIVLTEG